MEKNSNLRLVITLVTIGLVSAFVLTFVYQWTTPYIEANQAEIRRRAINEVLPGAEEIEEIDIDGDIFYKAYDQDNRKIGVATQHSGAGYNGMIDVMVGVDIEEQKVLNISIVEHEETPGLGARITEEEYRRHFQEKPFGDYQAVSTEPTDPMEVQIIAGATISSEAVMKIVENAVDKINTVYGGR
ncbi:RnfABCDGE type electron transport complex subunit G [Halanaerobium hydrogeniformans]|uniref:Ion-translocating oxidoreductase complex subunit G n=1 Tax=Halanaerobium hydrogeniformans TaxID=656519 RepID=E4RML8_HALHG|nr:RnfABCDGE type electron transport complex subunit G [Halanaerobium hydrogeniformans]ADQ14549.1 electron transport complex, RnfABCDGE type, G subunit [Halanaerobium hydrogeniformans]